MLSLSPISKSHFTYAYIDNILYAAFQLVWTINKQCGESAFLDILGSNHTLNTSYNDHRDLLGIVARS